jgi:phage-related protein
MSWTIKYYSGKLQQEIMSLPAGIQARYIHYAKRMSIHGPNLGMPHTRAMGDGLFELRIKASEGIGRVFYCTLIEQRIIMLHTFMKKTPKTPASELAVARNRMKEVKADAHS